MVRMLAAALALLAALIVPAAAQDALRSECLAMANAPRVVPAAFREAIVLREFNDMSYREIAEVAGVPVGTVMSRLARGRALLLAGWKAREGTSQPQLATEASSNVQRLPRSAATRRP